MTAGAPLPDKELTERIIAAAMEGTQLGIPSIALSQAFGFGESHQVKWATAEHYAPGIIRKLVKAGWPDEVLININFPDVPVAGVKGIEVTAQGKRDQSLVRVEERIDAMIATLRQRSWPAVRLGKQVANAAAPARWSGRFRP